MSVSETLLFVGGPADGERREVPRGAPYYSVYKRPPVQLTPTTAFDAGATITAEVVRYRREWLQDDRRRYAVMLIDDATPLIAALLAGYRRPPAQQVQA